MIDTMEFEKVKFNPEDDDNWVILLDFNRSLHRYLYPNEARISDEANKQEIIRQFSRGDIKFDIYLVFERAKRDKMIALFMVGFFYDGPDMMNKEVGITDIIVLPEYRRKGIAKMLFKDLHDIMKEHGIVDIICNSQEEEGKLMIEKMNGKVLESNIENRVYLKDIDWNLMNEWVTDGISNNKDVNLKVFSKIPDEYMNWYIAMQNEMLDYFPKDNLSLNEAMITSEMIRGKEEQLSFSGKTKITAILYTDKILAQTEMIFAQNNLDRIYQGLSYTLPRYVNKGLGKWMKAYMLRFVKDNYETVEFINSNLISDDAALLSINERIGFQRAKRYYTLEISTEQLGIYLHEFFHVLV